MPSDTSLRAAVIGCGGRGRSHAEGYAADPRTTIVACADPSTEARDGFAESFDVPSTYEDYHEMLRAELPDLVSVCTWPHFHREMIEAAASSGVRAILSEKPMAPTWGEARSMYQACIDRDVLLTFCHQRRFGDTFQSARQLVRDGATEDKSACFNPGYMTDSCPRKGLYQLVDYMAKSRRMLQQRGDVPEYDTWFRIVGDRANEICDVHRSSLIPVLIKNSVLGPQRHQVFSTPQGPWPRAL